MTCDAKRDGDSARLSSRKGRAERARRHAADAAVIKALQTAGARSLRAIAAEFNARGVPTATGIGKWEATQVRLATPMVLASWVVNGPWGRF
jgi:hypothetical protein